MGVHDNPRLKFSMVFLEIKSFGAPARISTWDLVVARQISYHCANLVTVEAYKPLQNPLPTVGSHIVLFSWFLSPFSNL